MGTCEGLSSRKLTNDGVDAAKDGAQAYYDSLFQLYAAWGVDFVKVDDIAASRLYHFHAADMLPLGHIGIRSVDGGGADRWTRFTKDEQITMLVCPAPASSVTCGNGRISLKHTIPFRCGYRPMVQNW